MRTYESEAIPDNTEVSGMPYDLSTAITIDGVINPYDSSLLLSLISRLGLNASISTAQVHRLTSREQAEHNNPNVIVEDIPISRDLNIPNNIVLREHFVALANQIPPRFTKQTYSRAFHYLVDGSFGLNGDRSPNLSNALYQWDRSAVGKKRWIQIREASPPTGIQIVKRSDIGIAPYEGVEQASAPDVIILSQYGIVASSIINAVGNDVNPNSQTIRAIREDLIPHLKQVY